VGGDVEPPVSEGPALLGFVAARIAEKREGIAAIHAERAPAGADRRAPWVGPQRARAD
jgi:hypothetical protein